jgi:hypothetical protein
LNPEHLIRLQMVSFEGGMLWRSAAAFDPNQGDLALPGAV